MKCVTQNVSYSLRDYNGLCKVYGKHHTHIDHFKDSMK